MFSSSARAPGSGRPLPSHRHQPRPSIFRRKSALGEQSPALASRPGRQRPADRLQSVVGRVVQAREGADVEKPAAVVRDNRTARHARERSAAAEVQAKASSQPMRRGDFGEMPPIGARLPGGGTERALAGNRRSELVTVPSFSPQPAAGSNTSANCVVSVGQQSETTTNGQAASAVPHFVGARHADRGIGRHDPDRFDPPVGDGVEHVDRFKARLGAPMRGACQKRRMRSRSAGIVEAHMRGELIGQTADFASAHGVGLAGDRERPACPAGRCVRWRDGS